MELFATVAYFVVFIFFIILIVRLIFSWIQVFSRDWRPTGVMLLIAETVYTITDPPLNFLRKILPPLRLGAVSIDLAFLVLIFGCSILLNVLIRVAS